MEDAWQSDIAPSNGGISIPSDVGLANGNGSVPEEQWRDEPRGDPPRRSSRSRSPTRDDRDRERDRGRASPGGQNPGNNLHVSNLSHRVDSRDLEAHFGKIGRVKKAQVMRDPHSHDSRGFGFVTMESPEEAEAAVTALNGIDFMGKAINVEKARRGRARTPTPGRYHGPPKRSERGGSGRDGPSSRSSADRMYDPRPYDSRYSRDRRPRHEDRGGDRYHRDYEGGYSGRSGGRDYEGGGGGRYDDRGYDDRRRGYDDRRY